MSSDLKIGPLVIHRFDPKIVGVVRGNNFSKIKDAIQDGADVIEVRIDLWEEDFGDATKALKDLKQFRKEGDTTPLIGTIYRTSDMKGGGFSGTETERLALFKQSMEYVDAIDISFTSTEIRDSVIAEARKKEKAVILSRVLQPPENKVESTSPWLDYASLMEVIEDMVSIDADCYKVTTVAITTKDMIAHMYALLDMVDKYPDKPFVGISTDVNGMASRVIFPLLGSYFTYGFLKHEPQCGRVSIKWLRETIDFLREAIPLIEDIRKTQQIPPEVLEALQ